MKSIIPIVNQMEVKLEDDIVRADRAPSEDLPEENTEEDFHPGKTQTFDYNHRSRPVHDDVIEEDAEDEDIVGFRKREVFDYNHQHLPWDMGPSLPPDMGPSLPPDMGPLPPFPPHPRWGPLPPHLHPPDLPPPDLPPPDLPPPIPYFDLPAGLMVAIVPVSFSFILVSFPDPHAWSGHETTFIPACLAFINRCVCGSLSTAS